MKKITVTQEYCTLLLLEVLYLWNSLPTCTRDSVKKMIEGKENETVTPLIQKIFVFTKGCICGVGMNIWIEQGWQKHVRLAWQELLLKHDLRMCNEPFWLILDLFIGYRNRQTARQENFPSPESDWRCSLQRIRRRRNVQNCKFIFLVSSTHEGLP